MENIYDVAAYLETLETVKRMQAKLFIPAHAAVTENISNLARYNINKVMEIAEAILGICEQPRSFEMIMQYLFSDYGLDLTVDVYYGHVSDLTELDGAQAMLLVPCMSDIDGQGAQGLFLRPADVGKQAILDQRRLGKGPLFIHSDDVAENECLFH